MRLSTLKRVAACIVGALVFGVSAQATPVSITVSTAGGPTMTFNATPTGGEGTTEAFAGTQDVGDWTMKFDITADADPFVNNNIVLTNNTNATQTYTTLIQIPISPTLPSPNHISGSVAGTLTNNNSPSATLTNVSPDSIYTAYIDGVAVRNLILNPYSLSTASSANVPAASFTNENYASAVTTSIAIQLRFTLSAGDSASFTSVFDVEPGAGDNTPEPGSLSLLGLGALALIKRRR